MRQKAQLYGTSSFENEQVCHQIAVKRADFFFPFSPVESKTHVHLVELICMMHLPPVYAFAVHLWKRHQAALLQVGGYSVNSDHLD